MPSLSIALQLGLAAGLAAVVMTAVWAASVRLRNAGIVDVAWSALFTPLALLYAVTGGGDALRAGLVAGMAILWSLRLAVHLGRRIVAHLDVEDARYAELRRSWGAGADAKMLLFFLFQGVTNVVLSLPVLLAARNPAPGLAPLELAAAGLWLAAFAGESTADAQLRRFRADPANRGAICATGLWRWSRHPNYFFEWLIWCALFLFALGSPGGWAAAVSPLLMLWFLLKVTGIPATEAHMLRTRGDAYRRHQETTSAFVPWPPREVR